MIEMKDSKVSVNKVDGKKNNMSRSDEGSSYVERLNILHNTENMIVIISVLDQVIHLRRMIQAIIIIKI